MKTVTEEEGEEVKDGQEQGEAETEEETMIMAEKDHHLALLAFSLAALIDGTPKTSLLFHHQ